MEGERKFSDGSSVYYHKGTESGGFYDGYNILTSIVEVDNLTEVLVIEDYTFENLPGEWDTYSISKLYADNEYLFISPDENLNDNSHELTDIQSGWYFGDFTDKVDRSKICYKNQYFPLYRVKLFIRCYDQYLVIDGRRIDFSEYWPQRKFNMTVEDIPATGTFGAGKRYTREVSTTFLGREFYAACVMNIYQKQ